MLRSSIGNSKGAKCIHCSIALSVNLFSVVQPSITPNRTRAHVVQTHCTQNVISADTHRFIDSRQNGAGKNVHVKMPLWFLSNLLTLTLQCQFGNLHKLQQSSLTVDGYWPHLQEETEEIWLGRRLCLYNLSNLRHQQIAFSSVEVLEGETSCNKIELCVPTHCH